MTAARKLPQNDSMLASRRPAPEIRPEATRELHEAITWYESDHPGL